MRKRFALLSSTSASVAKTVFAATGRDEFDIDIVITDRQCGALVFAHENKIPLIELNHPKNIDFSNALLETLENYGINYVYVFFSRILCGRLLESYAGRLINFHPSILPACPGLNGFEDTIASGALIAGSTTHLIDSGVDTGRKIIQTITPVFDKSKQQVRHVVFAQQCASLFYVHSKLLGGNLLGDNDYGEVDLKSGFVPNISQRALHIYNEVVAM